MQQTDTFGLNKKLQKLRQKYHTEECWIRCCTLCDSLLLENVTVATFTDNTAILAVTENNKATKNYHIKSTK